jgi:PrtD family type I secretion system ABC transporter
MSREQDHKNNALKEALTLCNRAFSANFIFSFFINILMLSTSIYSLQILDRVLSSNSVETLIMLSLIMIVIYIILAFLQTIRALVFNQISNWLDSKLSSTLLANSISFEATTKGSQNIRDLQSLKSFINSSAVTHLFDAPWSIIYFIVIFFIHWINGFIVVIGATVLLILALLNEKLTKSYVEKSNELNVISMKKIDSISRNAEVIKAMGMKLDMTNTWQKLNTELNNITKSLTLRSSIISNITRSLRLFLQMAVMASGAMLVIKGKMSAGGIIATSILTGKALAPFDHAITIYKSFLNAKASYLRLANSLENLDENEEKIELPEPKGDVQLDKLIYKIPNTDLNIIKGINISINAGEVIGLIGPSGSGKTTLARLITNVLQPNKGSVRIDGADIKNQDSEIVGQYIGYLPQDVELFEGTIKANISRMKDDAKSESIIEAAKFAGIHDLINKLPQAYETNANILSAGQRQRIGLARSFFGKPKLVVLDEPNSNLDAEGEVALMQAIQNARASNITTIIISHKPSILSVVDKILVLKDGQAKIFDEAKTVIKQLAGDENDK